MSECVDCLKSDKTSAWIVIWRHARAGLSTLTNSPVHGENLMKDTLKDCKELQYDSA